MKNIFNTSKLKYQQLIQNFDYNNLILVNSQHTNIKKKIKNFFLPKTFGKPLRIIKVLDIDQTVKMTNDQYHRKYLKKTSGFLSKTCFLSIYTYLYLSIS